MKRINLAITGCMGRMGQQLIKSAKKNKIFKLVSLTENRKISKKISGIKPEINSLAAFKKTNVIKKTRILGVPKKLENCMFCNFRSPGPRTSSPGCDFTSIGGRRAPEDDI